MINMEKSSPPLRLLLITTVIPEPDKFGTSLRALSIARWLATYGHLTLIATPGQLHEEFGQVELGMRELADAVHYLPPLEGGIAEGHRRFGEMLGDESFDVVVVFRTESYALARPFLSRAKHRIIDLDEFASLREKTMAQAMMQVGLQEEAEMSRRMAAYHAVLERSCLKDFDTVLVSSVKEQEVAVALPGCPKALVVPNVYPDVQPLEPLEAGAPQRMLYVGALGYYPNEDAVLWFAHEILPLIRRELGEGVIFQIVGSGAMKSGSGLQGLPGVELSGYLKDLRPVYESSALSVVPLRLGSGTRLKILEAFSLGRAVVSTSKGAEGINAIAGEHLDLADDPAAFAASCVSLLRTPEKRWSMEQSARNFVVRSYSQAALNSGCRDLLRGFVDGKRIKHDRTKIA